MFMAEPREGQTIHDVFCEQIMLGSFYFKPIYFIRENEDCILPMKICSCALKTLVDCPFGLK